MYMYRNKESGELVLNGSHLFTPWHISQQTEPTNKMCHAITTYIEDHVEELMRVTIDIHDDIDRSQAIISEAIKGLST